MHLGKVSIPDSVDPTHGKSVLYASRENPRATRVSIRPDHYDPSQWAAWEIQHFCGKREWRE